jgi:hypothetical protein
MNIWSPGVITLADFGPMQAAQTKIKMEELNQPINLLHLIIEPDARQNEDGSEMKPEEMKAEDDAKLRKIHTRYLANGG